MDTPEALFEIAKVDATVKHYLDLWLHGSFAFDEMLTRCLTELIGRHYQAIDKWELEQIPLPFPDLFDLAWDIRQKRLIRDIYYASYLFSKMLVIVNHKISMKSEIYVVSIDEAKNLNLMQEDVKQ